MEHLTELEYLIAAFGCTAVTLIVVFDGWIQHKDT